MPIPLIPVLIGAAAGAAVTYLLMNGSTRKSLTNTAQDVSDTVESGARRVKTAVTDAVDDATEAAKDATSKVVDD